MFTMYFPTVIATPVTSFIPLLEIKLLFSSLESCNSFSNKHSALINSANSTRWAQVRLNRVLEGGSLAQKTHLHVRWSWKWFVRMADHDGTLVIFPRCNPSTNKTRIFVQWCHLSKRSTFHTAEKADMNVVSERSSFLKYFVTT